MKKIFLFIVFVLLNVFVFAQYKITLNQIPQYTSADADIFMAGDFNGWNPGDEAYKLSKTEDDKYFILLNNFSDGQLLNFKFTRGSWQTVEKGENGEEIDNRQISIVNGDSISLIVYNWADHGGGGGSTASDNVSIMAESFYMPQLNKNRRVWIYLPPDYQSSEKLYPVLYMHDGQNLFDANTSYAGEWEVDETLDDLYSQGYSVPIVIGIDNGGVDRIDEYTPWTNPQWGGGEGDKYAQFIVITLKPYVDSAYRTLPDRENTAIMGSSLGGLISHYIFLKYQNIFSKAGLYSPSYWFSDSVWTLSDENPKQAESRVYQMCGSLEGDEMTNDLSLMDEKLRDNGFTEDELFKTIIPGGQHNEQLWREDFENAYKWLFKDYIGGINNKQQQTLIISPNPASNTIELQNYTPRHGDTLNIYNSNGNLVISLNNIDNEPIEISSLTSGSYVVKLKSDVLWVGVFVVR